MNIKNVAVLLFLSGLLTACFFNDPEDDDPPPPETITKFKDVSASNLPLANLSGNSMAAKSGDIDGDGDPDLVVAIEFDRNRILINNGSGIFEDQSQSRLPGQNFDSEGMALADFDADQDRDLFFASSENQTNEFYLNTGSGAFNDLSNRIPVTGNSHAALSSDIDGDGDFDLLIGNDGQNIALINNGNAIFSNQTSNRFPQLNDITQDLEDGDIDGDGDLDLIVANEDNNRILLNTGSGFFADQTQNRLPFTGAVEETREADLADIDGDGDLDLYLANAALFQSNANPRDRLLINNGQGIFTDVSSNQLPEITTNTMDADFIDLDRDGDPDIIAGDLDGEIQILVNGGSGTFTDQSAEWIPEDVTPRVLDFETGDYNSDGLTDLYVCTFDGPDLLLLQRETE